MADDLNDMLLFAQVARHGSLTRAAQVAGVPKSTLSRRLAALEERLGTQLMVRTTRKLALTEAGHAFVERCSRILEEVEEAREFAGALGQKPQGRLRVALPPDFAMHWLAEPIAEFSQRYPDIALDIELTTRHVDLISEGVDCMVRVGHLPDSGLYARKLADIERGLYASPHWLAGRAPMCRPEELPADDFIGLAEAVRNPVVLRQGRKRFTLTMRPRLAVSSIVLIRHLAMAGAGIADLPVKTSAPEVAAGRLVQLCADWSLEPVTATLLTPSRRLLPTRTRVFIEHLAQSLAGDLGLRDSAPTIPT